MSAQDLKQRAADALPDGSLSKSTAKRVDALKAADLEQRARELLKAEYERARLGRIMRCAETGAAIRAIVAALRQQPAPVVSASEVFRIAGGDTECEPNPTPERALEVLRDLRACYDEALRDQPAPVVDDARMARALEWVRVMAMQDADGSHVSAIEEAIAAYDPNCGARTVRVADDALADTQRAIIEAAERRGYERAKAEAVVVDDAMRELIEADKEYDAIRQRAQRYPCPGMDEHVMAVRKRRAAAIARAQGAQS